MLDHVWDFFVESMITLFMPCVFAYFALTSDPFLNVAIEGGSTLERTANQLLIPYQYIFAGREAVLKEDGTFELVQRFDYSKSFWPNTVSSALSLPASFILGGTAKALSCLERGTRERMEAVVAVDHATDLRSEQALYKSLGIPLGDPVLAERLIPQGHVRGPGGEKKLESAKEGLKAIAEVLNEAGIPWWVDCGTLLGTYRYGGVIPWDEDVDISILLPDFENARRALNRLDPALYLVQDWSGRDFPHTYFKVFVKKTYEFIDIDCFAIDEEKRELSCVFSLDKHLFFPEWFKIRERRFTAPLAYETLFPLKKGTFDGIEVFVPNDTVKYLQRVYGECLDPAKVYDPQTGLYEKDLSHPYWQRAYVH